VRDATRFIFPDRNFLNARCTRNLSPDEQSIFLDALHLCPTNDKVNEINEAKLHEARTPVLIAPAPHTGPTAKRASEDQAEGLVPKLFLMEGAKVMLTHNLWTKQRFNKRDSGNNPYLSISNNTDIDKILFTPEQTPHTDLPALVMVAIPSYKGPTRWHTEDGTPIVPITPFIVQWKTKIQKSCSRVQYPLRIAYTMTIHKSQGMTLDKAVVDPGLQDICPGMLFVALSRVRQIGDLALSGMIGIDQLKRGGDGMRFLEEDNLCRGQIGFEDVEDMDGQFDIYQRMYA
jgi:ATP-dependent DNA helicase PIF1